MNCKYWLPVDFRKRYTSNGACELMRLTTVSVLNSTRCRFSNLEAAHDAVEGRLLAFVDAVGVVHFDCGTIVDGEADEEIVRRERNSHHSSSRRVPLVWMALEMGFTAGEFFLERNGFAEKGSTPSRVRFAALPGEIDFSDGLALDVLANVSLEHRVAHAPLIFTGIEIFLLEIEAIFAIEVANRPDRFGQDVKRSSRVRDLRLVQADRL